MFFVFLSEELVSLESIKGEFWDLVVLILCRNLEMCFPGFCIFFVKASQRKWIFGQIRINFTKQDKNGKQTEEVTLLYLY